MAKQYGRSRPSFAYEDQMRRQLKNLIAEMRKDTEKAIKEYCHTEMAMDGRAEVMAKLRERWYSRFETRGREISSWMGARVNKRTNDQISRKFKLMGMVRQPKYTEAHKAAIRELAANSTSYIKSIPQKYMRNVQRTVAESFEKGVDRGMLAATLEKIYEKLKDVAANADEYAALVARDQSNKMTQGYALINAEAYGAKKGRWIHVSGLKSSRSTHEAMDGQEFDLAEGLYDEDVGENVRPGELIYCQCQFEVIMPGFETEPEEEKEEK